MLECARYQGRNGKGNVKRESSEKEGLVKNCQNIISVILQIGPKMLNPNMSFGLHYNLNPFHYVPLKLSLLSFMCTYDQFLHYYAYRDYSTLIWLEIKCKFSGGFYLIKFKFHRLFLRNLFMI